MSHFTKVDGTWKKLKPYTKVAGAWRLADYIYNRVGGRWYTSFVKGGLIDKSWDDRDQTGPIGTASNSTINAFAVQSDGKIVAGGQFNNWSGTTISGRIVRLNSDCTRDTSFPTTGANNTINAIAIQSDGKILVGGSFTSWNGITVGRIVRLNTDGTRDTTFTTNTGTGAANIVWTITIQPSDGKILVGGEFTSWNGLTVGRIVRLNTDGTRDTTFTTNNGTGATNNIVNAIRTQSDGRILVTGSFSSWNGVTVGRIVRLESTGTRDTTFTTNNGTGATSGTIQSIGIQSDGKIVLGGTFTAWNGTTVGRIVRLESTGVRNTTFTTNTGSGANNTITAIVIQSDNKIVVGGNWTTWNGTTPRSFIRLNSDGTSDTAFITNNGTGPGTGVTAVAVQSDGKILVGGSFTTWNGIAVGRFVRINSDGTYSEALTTFANNSIRSMAIQSDSKIVVGGDFTTWNGTTVGSFGSVVRLNSDGTIDTAFRTNIGTGANGAVYGIDIQSDGKIVASGSFIAWNGTTVNRIVRLNTDGTRDTTFTTNVGTGGNSLAILAAIQPSDGKILVGGYFTLWNGVTVGYIVRLNSDGTRDTTFTTNVGTGANNLVQSFCIQSDGKILVGGQFTTWNGTTVGRIVRLNSDGTLDTAFTGNNGTGANSAVWSFAIQSDNKIVVGGNWTTWGGVSVGNLIRLNSDGTRDTTFSTNTGTGPRGSIFSIRIQSDGKILLGGGFNTWNDSTFRRYFVRIGGEDAS